MRLWLASALACVLLMADSMAVSSLGDVTVVKPARAQAIAHAPLMPLMLLVSRNGEPLGGVALTAQ
jgi:hypothetical protein